MTKISVARGDITEFAADVIVNAANTALSGGGGVDGAIHRAAGPELLTACRKLGRCPPGSAVITPGFRLKAQFVVHCVGPVWDGGSKNEDTLLASCHRESLRLAASVGARTVAFPAISCGAYKFPIPRAAAVSVEAVRSFLHENPDAPDVVFVCFAAEAFEAFHREVQRKELT